jgi:hypothetical protein
MVTTVYDNPDRVDNLEVHLKSASLEDVDREMIGRREGRKLRLASWKVAHCKKDRL